MHREHFTPPFLLDRDLAALYGVETKRVNEQVKRNIERFPKDFCFQLDATEHKFLRSQIATTKTETRGGRQYFPYAFTEQGVAMLSSVLKSESAIKVNIAIMRAFVQLRHLMMGNGGLVNRLSNVEAKDLEQEHLLLYARRFHTRRSIKKNQKNMTKYDTITDLFFIQEQNL